MTQISRRDVLKSIVLSVGLPYLNLKPLAYIYTSDTILDGKTTRGWHVYWAHHPNAEQKCLDASSFKYLKNVKRTVIYDKDDFPANVRHVVDLHCPLAPPITSYEQFHCFQTW